MAKGKGKSKSKAKATPKPKAEKTESKTEAADKKETETLTKGWKKVFVKKAIMASDEAPVKVGDHLERRAPVEPDQYVYIESGTAHFNKWMDKGCIK